MYIKFKEMGCESGSRMLGKDHSFGVAYRMAWSRHRPWRHTDVMELLKPLRLQRSKAWVDMENGKEDERHLDQKTMQNSE